jgi:hypothetical protein
MSLSNIQIEKLVKKYNIKNFIGVYSKDRLPDKKREGWYIINMENYDDGQGTHWVCAKYDKVNSIYIDSFGFPPPLVVEEYFDDPIYNTQQVQHLKSLRCGHFCLYFIKKFNQKFTLDEILSKFSKTDLMSNDDKITI